MKVYKRCYLLPADQKSIISDGDVRRRGSRGDTCSDQHTDVTHTGYIIEDGAFYYLSTVVFANITVAKQCIKTQ